MKSDTQPSKSGKKRDPDKYSPTLKRYHKLLWTKPLPCGMIFELDDKHKGSYLYHKSVLGEFFLTSDSVIPTFTRRSNKPQYLSLLPNADLEKFYNLSYTIGGMMLFPGNRVLYDGKERPTINGERGLNHKISDRFDLTVECIRRFYNGEESPLHGCLNRYSGYFAIFDNFEGYIKFFLLQDIVNENYTVVKMFTEFNPDFRMKPVPQTADVYRDYMENTINFLNKRNKRMLNWVQSNCAEG